MISKSPVAQDARDYGMRVLINLGEATTEDDGMLANDAIYAADKGTMYSGPSSPWWYGVRDLQMLFSATPAGTTIGDVLMDLGLEHEDSRPAKLLERDQVETLLDHLRLANKPVLPEKLGKLGEDAYGYDGYGSKLGTVNTLPGAVVPYVIEAWANAEPAEEKGISEAQTILLMNRTRVIARFRGFARNGGIVLAGCGIQRKIELKSAQYRAVVSVITPYVQLAGDGKEPVLAPLGNAIHASSLLGSSTVMLNNVTRATVDLARWPP